MTRARTVAPLIAAALAVSPARILAAPPSPAAPPAAAPADPGAPAVAPPPELAAARARIDAIDAKLLELLSERARVALEVAEVKRRRGLPIRVPAREAQVVAALQARNAGPLPGEAVARIWERIFEEMRSVESAAR